MENQNFEVVVFVGTDENQSPPAAVQVRTGVYASTLAAHEAGTRDCERLGGHGFTVKGLNVAGA